MANFQSIQIGIDVFFPIFCGWIADQEEHTSLLNILSQAWARCEVRYGSLGELDHYPIRDLQNNQRTAKVYYDNPSVTVPIEELITKSLQALYNTLWTLPRIQIQNLHKPNLVHKIYVGVLKHLIEWILAFLVSMNPGNVSNISWIGRFKEIKQ